MADPSSTQEQDEARRRRIQQQASGQTQTATPPRRNLPPNSAANTGALDVGTRAAALYDNPQAAFINALRTQGIDPYTSYYGMALRKRYGNAARDLFNLKQLESGGRAGVDASQPGAAGRAIDAGLSDFQNFVSNLVSGVSGGANLNTAVGFDPRQALRSIFDATKGATGLPQGLGYSLFSQDGGPADAQAMREWLMRMQATLMGLSGANPLYQRAFLNQGQQLVNEFDAAFGGGQPVGGGREWLDIILNRL